jgi:hypothetical protein
MSRADTAKSQEAKLKEQEVAQQVAAGTYVDPDAEKDRGDYAGDLRRENMKLHCYICKKNGHTKRDCPNKRCRYCFEIGHEREDCEQWKTELARLQKEDKKKKRKKAYEKKKWTKYQERSRALRDATGVHGFASLYRVLGLSERKLASEKDIKRAYRKMAVKWHPDKNPGNEEEAQERFEEIKAAYDLLLEVIQNGSVEGHSVFSAGELQNYAAPASKAPVATSEPAKVHAAWG